MKEKERFKEMLDYLKGNGIRWGIEIHDHRIWHAIVEFPLDSGYECVYARGYSVLAHMDADLDRETKLVRGPLISIGRALKAESRGESVAPVLNNNIVGYLLSQNCPTSPLEDKFYKGQFNVKPTHSEGWLLLNAAQFPNRQYGLPGYDPRAVRRPLPSVPVPMTEWSNQPLVDFIESQIKDSGRFVDRDVLLSKIFKEYQKDPHGASVSPHDFRKLFDSAWLAKNGFALETRVVIKRA
jgi:hypothetical protein